MILKNRPHATRMLRKVRPYAIGTISALLLLAAVGGLVLAGPAHAAQAPVPLLTAASAAITAGTTVTNVGAGTTIVGDIVLYPGTAITGLIQTQVTGTIHSNDPGTPPGLAHDGDDGAHDLVKTHVSDAYDFAANAPTTGAIPGGVLSGSLGPGVYKSTGFSLTIPGSVTLNGGGNADAVWIFQATSDMITASASSVNLINGAQACNVFWQVTSSATLNPGSTMEGTILALQSITTPTTGGVTVRGRLLARNAAVNLENVTITRPSTCIKQADVDAAAAAVVAAAAAAEQAAAAARAAAAVAAEAARLAEVARAAAAAAEAARLAEVARLAALKAEAEAKAVAAAKVAAVKAAAAKAARAARVARAAAASAASSARIAARKAATARAREPRTRAGFTG